ncbi:MAG: efflux RND transporter permease subunit [Salinivirgaceae bacterium]|jgi:multidrug efflux pump|nr:efflux RND transporter permease subunit [Salinivirgaceae bacterium]
MSTNINNDNKHREFKLTTIALKNKNTVYLLTAILLIFGISSYQTLPKELFPEIVWPQIVVNTVYPGNAPEDIENLVTRPLEKELENVRGLKEITSISAQDASMIFVEFNTDVDIEDALRRVKDGVDNTAGELPNDLPTDPMVMDIDFSEFPILNINLSGDYSIEELKKYAEYLEDEMEEIKEVSKVLIEGVNEREIKINVDLFKLEAYDLSFNNIIGAVQGENITMSGGEIMLGQTRRNIRVLGEFDSMKDIENIIISTKDGNIVYLRDVAEVIDGYEEPSTFARLNNEAVVSVQVVKKGGENLLSTTKQVFEVLNKSQANNMLPKDLKISITNDQSEQVKEQLSNLENSMIMGVIFVIVVLFFFLGTRNALFVGFAIPTSMMISFVIINLIGFRINMMVLFALILALGMLVDNAIVVVENIYRYVDNGFKPWEASKRAVGEIAIPIIASTLTTLAAFLPLAMWGGIMGEFMKYLPITLIIVLSSSLFVALVIIPVFSSSFIKTKGVTKESEAKTRKVGLYSGIIMIVLGGLLLLANKMTIGNLLVLFGIIGIFNMLFLSRMESWFQDIFLVKLERVYEKALRFAIKGWNLVFFFGGTILLMIITIMLFFTSSPNIVLFPDSDPGFINIVAELPVGTDITGTNDFVYKLEEDIIGFLKEEGALIPNDTTSVVESILATVGKGDPNDFSSSGSPNKALITVSFIDFDLRGEMNTSLIMRDLSDFLAGRYPGVELAVTKNSMGPPTGKPINLEIIGQDFDQLVHLADTIKTVIDRSNIEGIEGLKMNVSTQQPELLIHIDRNKAQRFGLSTGMIASTLRNGLFGFEASDFKVGEDEYPIQVRLKDEYRYDLTALENMKITVFGDGPPTHIPLSSVAEFEYSTTFSSVRRKDLDRVVTLYSNVNEGYNANTINVQMAAVLESFEMPNGYSFEFTGEQQDQQESSDFLGKAMLIALALIMLILVTQFNSLIRTVIIMMSILFSTIGVFGGLWTFNMDFIIVMTGVGVISLAGIVVNNAIVLIDYIELLKIEKRRELGYEENAFLPVSIATECIIQGGKTRLRPVLLTAITTILGLIPMAIGLNIDFQGMFASYSPDISFGGDMAAMWSPMSWTVIFGLTFSTFLTLVIVPVMYRMTTIAQKKMMVIMEMLKERSNGNTAVEAEV